MSPMVDLKNSVAIVTGAARGLGEAIALALAEAGAAIGILDVSDGATVVSKIEGAGGRAKFLRCDVADFEQCRSAIMELETALGSVDILVNNAAVYTGLERQDFDAIDENTWEAVLRVNVTGVWNMCRAAGPAMRARRRGSIINISSSTARTGAMGMAHYVTSKAAVAGLTRALARELGDAQVRVNSVSPTLIANEASVGRKGFEVVSARAMAQQCLPRNATVDDITGTVVYLASDLSAFVTGQTLAVDGGLDLL
jgi:NAD(P)-dependent dehydrogenase (short-subunit alcohol dehydrogenase family)